MNRRKPVGASKPAEAPQPAETSRSRTLAAAARRILPSDDAVGAAETGVAEYIDKALRREVPAAERALVERGLDLLEASARERLGRSFADGSPDEQDDLLRRLEGLDEPWPRAFLRRLVLLALEGFLCDPRRGGNRNGLGWSFIGVRPRTPDAVPDTGSTPEPRS